MEELKTEILNFKLQNISLELEVTSPDSDVQVFRPTIPGVTGYIGENVRISKGERGSDVGCGNGVFAILSAKLGAEVYAVDIQPEACELTERNAERNGVAHLVKVRQGNIFEPLKDAPPVNFIIGDVAGLPYVVSEPW